VEGTLPQLLLVAVLVLANAAFAGSELALVSLREGQLRRLEAGGGSGQVLARLAREPNRFLATIQIGITLAGFLASATAAVSLAEPLESPLGFLGEAARPVAIVVVTLLLAYLTLVFGELAPKRVAMQRAEGWGLIAARPLALLSAITRPAVWLLSHSTDLAVRLMGGDPERQREEVSEEELRDLVGTHRAVSPQQRVILSGAFEITERTLGQVLRARRDVIVLTAGSGSADALEVLVASGHSRAPVAEGGDLDHVVGVVHLRDLIGAGATPVRDRAAPALFIPESAKVLDALRQLQEERQQLAVVVDEHGGGAGIVTVEDLLEELVGEIYDETDRDVAGVQREAARCCWPVAFRSTISATSASNCRKATMRPLPAWCSPSSAGFPTDRVMRCASTDGPPPSWLSTTTRSPVYVYAAMSRKGRAANDSRAAPTSSPAAGRPTLFVSTTARVFSR
jgi:putative hemolysin